MARKTGMSRSRALGALLGVILSGQSASALELRYVSHLNLHHPEIGFTEPSGLAVDPDGSGFWIVSDEAEAIFRLEASSGDLRTFTGQDSRMKDLEGVTVDADRGRLLLVSERTANIVTMSLLPPHRVTAIDLAALPGVEYLDGVLQDRRNGLEGISIDPDTGAVYVLKEDAPRLLIELAPGIESVISVLDLDQLLPGDGDVSGLAVDNQRHGLWILSDQDKAVYFLPNSGDAPLALELFWRDEDRMHRLDNAEGVALSPDGQDVFILTDDGKHSKLIQYRVLTVD